MYELDGHYVSNEFTLVIKEKKFSLINQNNESICSGFIAYVSSYILKNNNTKLAITNRNIFCPTNNNIIAIIESMFYQDNKIIIKYTNQFKDIKTITLTRDI